MVHSNPDNNVGYRLPYLRVGERYKDNEGCIYTCLMSDGCEAVMKHNDPHSPMTYFVFTYTNTVWFDREENTIWLMKELQS